MTRKLFAAALAVFIISSCNGALGDAVAERIGEVTVESDAGSLPALVSSGSVWRAVSLADWIEVGSEWHRGTGAIVLEYGSNRSVPGLHRSSRLGAVLLETSDGAEKDTLILRQKGYGDNSPCGGKAYKRGGISVEFPVLANMKTVSVLLAASGDADILLSGTSASSGLDGFSSKALSGGRVLASYGNLALVGGACDEAALPALLEETFWSDPSLEWIFALQLAGSPAALQQCGFSDILAAAGLESDGTLVFAGSEAYDRIDDLTAGPVSFTVKVKEAAL